MATFLTSKIRPTKGFAHFLHIAFVAVMPIALLILVRLNLDVLALLLILLSKWRMFAVKAHHWVAHIRTNAVDIIVGLSILACMSNTGSLPWQLLWVVLYELWLLVLKPGSNVLMVSLQAVVAQTLGFISIFLVFEDIHLALVVLAYGFIAYFCARHFLSSFDEPHAQILASQWGFFAAALMWVLGHWLLFIGPIAQPALILSVLGYGLGGLYYLEETDKLSRLVRRQILLVMITVILVVLVFANWGDKTV